MSVANIEDYRVKNAYTLKLSERTKWKLLTKDLLDNSDDKKFMENSFKMFVDQLTIDLKNFDEGKNVSACVIGAPRINSSTDKRTSIAKKLAEYFFPIENPKFSDDDTEEDKANKFNAKKIWTYIKYSQMIAKLSQVYRVNILQKIKDEQDLKNARFCSIERNFCVLKKREPSCQIIEPEAMPVNVAKLGDLQQFFDYMKTNKPIQSTDMYEQGSEYMEFKMGAFYDDKRIDLCKQVVGPDHIEALMDSIKGNPYVEHFLLGNNIIGQVGATSIANFITSDTIPKIKTWYLAGNDINADGLANICSALEQDEVAEALWLKRNPILSEGCVHLSKMLQINKTLEVLDLHNTGIMDEGIQYLFDGLKKNNTLLTLYLDANGITSKGAAYIAKYFNYLVKNQKKGITSMWLTINRLDDDGVKLLADSLANYYHLERLCIGSNRVTSVGAKAILEALYDHKKLIMLDLGWYKSTFHMGELPNRIGDEGVPYITEFIKKNKSVQYLSICHNKISQVGMEQIAEALEYNDTLLHLDYPQFGIVFSADLKNKIKNKFHNNVKKQLGITHKEFHKGQLRKLKHTSRIRTIDSIYRNNM